MESRAKLFGHPLFLLLVLVTAWLGGELVDRLGIGVDTGAHVDAPSSLSVRSGAGGIARATKVELAPDDRYPPS